MAAYVYVQVTRSHPADFGDFGALVRSHHTRQDWTVFLNHHTGKSRRRFRSPLRGPSLPARLAKHLLRRCSGGRRAPPARVEAEGFRESSPSQPSPSHSYNATSPARSSKSPRLSASARRCSKRAAARRVSSAGPPATCVGARLPHGLPRRLPCHPALIRPSPGVRSQLITRVPPVLLSTDRSRASSARLRAMRSA